MNTIIVSADTYIRVSAEIIMVYGFDVLAVLWKPSVPCIQRSIDTFCQVCIWIGTVRLDTLLKVRRKMECIAVPEEKHLPEN